MEHKTFAILHQRQGSSENELQLLKGEREMERNCKEEATSEFSKEDDLHAAKRAKPLCQHPSQKEEGLQS